jgi:hypothetical protein
VWSSNGYGPTEGTTFTCCRTVTKAAEVGASVPIWQTHRRHTGVRVGSADASGAGWSNGRVCTSAVMAWREATGNGAADCWNALSPLPFGVGNPVISHGDKVKWLRRGVS